MCALFVICVMCVICVMFVCCVLDVCVYGVCECDVYGVCVRIYFVCVCVRVRWLCAMRVTCVYVCDVDVCCV